MKDNRIWKERKDVFERKVYFGPNKLKTWQWPKICSFLWRLSLLLYLSLFFLSSSRPVSSMSLFFSYIRLVTEIKMSKKDTYGRWAHISLFICVGPNDITRFRSCWTSHDNNFFPWGSSMTESCFLLFLFFLRLFLMVKEVSLDGRRMTEKK